MGRISRWLDTRPDLTSARRALLDREVHASAMVVLIIAHMILVFAMSAYKYPREAVRSSPTARLQPCTRGAWRLRDDTRQDCTRPPTRDSGPFSDNSRRRA